MKSTSIPVLGFDIMLTDSQETRDHKEAEDEIKIARPKRE